MRSALLGFVWDLFCLANVELREIVEDMKKLIKKLAPLDKERYLSIWFILHFVEDVSDVGLSNF